MILAHLAPPLLVSADLEVSPHDHHPDRHHLHPVTEWHKVNEGASWVASWVESVAGVNELVVKQAVAKVELMAAWGR